MYWVFFLVVAVLPATEPPVKEFFMYFDSRELCEDYQAWWNKNHIHLRATPCERIREETTVEATA